MSTGIIQIVKTAAMDAVNNAQQCDLRYGKVISTSPLRVQVTNQFTIPSSLLVVPEHLTNHQVQCTVSQPGESTSGKTLVSKTLENETDPIKNHTHEFTIESDGGTSTMMITVNNALKVGDKVALLRKQGGQSYFILDRI